MNQLVEDANNGNVEAQLQLGKKYYYGDGVEQDAEQGLFWYYKAAEQGLAEAQNFLAFCYLEGTSIKQDYKQAAYWYQKAAEQGNASSQRGLGLCYLKGYGILKDVKLAYMWVSISFNYVTEDKEQADFWNETLEKMKLGMTEAEIAEAQDMAAQWLENHAK